MLIVAILLLLCGLTLLTLSWRELSPSRIFLERPTTPAGDLRPGPAELAGVIRVDGVPPILSGLGTACVVVHTIVERRTRRNGFRELGRETRAAPAVLRDESGSASVSFDYVDLMGETWEIRDLDGKRVTQIIVPDGAQVLVSGLARPCDASAAGDAGNDRGRAVRHTMHGTEAEPLLLSIGSHAGAAWYYGWRPLLAGFCGVLLLVLAAGLAYVDAVL